ncbi:ATP-binding cassette domain-containing protein [Dawidia soli]|uniref:ATP-binding cassette domain-containing protein n=1 Tax=Dawidia soli TaxID=2782352 RepID=UPI003741EC05
MHASLVALVGPNGCGKSSVLDGILYHNNAYGKIGGQSGKDYTYHSMSQLQTFNYQNVLTKPTFASPECIPQVHISFKRSQRLLACCTNGPGAPDRIGTIASSAPRRR